ncbi:LacI family DNA-binding transcriptional regulator [Loktanella sp. IMCC34160]|uniref:LacI family DNA-binding transcriptional regulator n=1 Tax=Loktanella sp. IMCC34160 TaxID=2510646 RepID=UPI00101C818C|nr:LacI family DNA-binding transcriptional regulator [Loktanella sp. IMCC34160]RYG93277.1 LacI family DNA-binding transcriptional regulator [Loktanella sp. IMCC34160]
MTKEKRVTLDDVASLAGVSAITVSRALRQPDVVSEKVRARVESAVRRLGYVPNPAARQLASGRSNVIGVVIPSVTNNVFADVLRGIYDGVGEAGYEIQLANTRYAPSLEENALRLFASQKPAGVIVTGFDQSDASADLLAGLACPVVQIMDHGPTPAQMSIGFSHFDAAVAATRHLIDQGYTRLGFLGARMDPRTQKRFNGFRQTAMLAGVYSERRVVTTPEASSVTKGAALLSDLLAIAPEVDAVFCNNDDLALGAVFEARRRRLSVPGELGICGFNDLEMMAAAEPPVTSVRTPRLEMGRRAIEAVLTSLAAGTRDTAAIDLGFEIVARESTARASTLLFHK